MAAETTKFTEQWFQKEDGTIVLQKITEKGNVKTKAETIYMAGEPAPIPDGVALLPYSMVDPTEEATKFTEQWFQKEDGSIVLQKTAERGKVKTKSETVYKAGEPAPIPKGAVLLPYSMLKPNGVTSLALESPPPFRRGLLKDFDESSSTTKCIFSLAGLGCLFIILLLIWWAIIYPVLVLQGLIDRVYDWGDEKVNSDDEISSTAFPNGVPLAILLLNGCLSVILGFAV